MNFNSANKFDLFLVFFLFVNQVCKWRAAVDVVHSIQNLPCGQLADYQKIGEVRRFDKLGDHNIIYTQQMMTSLEDNIVSFELIRNSF